ncbi:hypothetical protein [Moraxella lacunata]|uniref:hypothetical protein n=1 Tax=Moraxella lacunata TaxID=477 RepID=UPI003EE09297
MTASTWRVVADAFLTSPNSPSRSKVRMSDVLPTLVCPMTMSLMGVAGWCDIMNGRDKLALL